MRGDDVRLLLLGSYALNSLEVKVFHGGDFILLFYFYISEVTGYLKYFLGYLYLLKFLSTNTVQII